MIGYVFFVENSTSSKHNLLGKGLFKIFKKILASKLKQKQILRESIAKRYCQYFKNLMRPGKYQIANYVI